MNRQKSSVKIIKPSKLTDRQIQQIANLYLQHHNISIEACVKRIQTKFDRLMILVESKEDRIVGFFGVNFDRFFPKPLSRPVLSLYMGQMYIEKAYRSQAPVHEAAIKMLTTYKIFCPWYRIVIWGDALTFKPYLLISQNFPQFYPHPDKQTPPHFKAIFDYLGNTKYGSTYDQETGCVTKNSKLIKDHVAPIPPRLLKHKIIGFYARKNEYYKKGNGLLIMGHFSYKALLIIFKKVYINGKKFNSIKWFPSLKKTGQKELISRKAS